MKPRFFFSVGMKMFLGTATLLALSFGVCTWAMVSMAERMLRTDLEAQIARHSQFLAAVSEELIAQDAPDLKKRLSLLTRHLLNESKILAITIVDRNHHVLAQASKPIAKAHKLFSLRAPIRSDHGTLGWVRAWYSPLFVLEEFWKVAGDWVVVVFCGALLLFAAALFGFNQYIIARPFTQFLTVIDESEKKGHLWKMDIDRRDEWGVLGERLNHFLRRLLDLQEQSTLLHDTSRLLGLPAGIKEPLEKILLNLLHRYHLSCCLVFVKPEDQADLRIDYAAGLSTSFTETWSSPSNEGTAGAVFSSTLPRWIPETREEEKDPFIRELIQRQQVRSVLAVPLMAEGLPWGVLLLGSQTPNALTEKSIEALTHFAHYVALAVRNQQMMARLENFNHRLESQIAATAQETTQTNARMIQKVRELKTVYDLALATAASTNVEDIIRVIIQGVKELIDVEGAAFFLLDKTSSFLEPLYPAFNRPAESTAVLQCKTGESQFIERIIQDGQPRILNFVDASDPLPASWNDITIRSILALPLRQDQKIRGLFCVVNKLNGLFGEDDIRLLSLLTSRVAEVLHRLALDQQLCQRVEDLSIVQDIASHLPRPPVLADTVNLIGGFIRQALTGVDVCAFFLHQAESDTLAMMGGAWNSSLSFDPKALTISTSEKSPLADVYQGSQAVHYGMESSPSVGGNDLLVQHLSLQAILYLPLTVEHRTIGVMALGALKKNGISTEDRRKAGLIAEQVAVIIERSRLYERLRSANDKLEQINHLKNEFISMVSHELRTPLTTIKGFVSIVLNEETGPLNDQQRHFLETSDRAIDRLALLVSDLLDISRIEAGQIKMQMRPTSLKEVLSRLATNFAPQLKAQSLSLTIRIPELLPLVMADPHRLTQVLDNLLSNAIKFTAKGGIVISATDKGDFILVSVKDTGSGMPPEEQERIFEKFYQIKVGGAWPAKGTGLGLAIVKSIVESHRGKVWVESEPGKGSDFRFVVPRARTESTVDSAIMPTLDVSK